MSDGNAKTSCCIAMDKSVSQGRPDSLWEKSHLETFLEHGYSTITITLLERTGGSERLGCTYKGYLTPNLLQPYCLLGNEVQW